MKVEADTLEIPATLHKRRIDFSSAELHPDIELWPRLLFRSGLQGRLRLSSQAIEWADAKDRVPSIRVRWTAIISCNHTRPMGRSLTDVLAIETSRGGLDITLAREDAVRALTYLERHLQRNR